MAASPTPSPSPAPIPPPRRPNDPLVRFATNPDATFHRLAHVVLAHLDRAAPALHHVFVPLVALLAALVALGVVALVVQRVGWRRGGHWIEIAPPAHPDPRGGLACWQMLSPLLSGRHGLGGRRPPVAFECVGDEGGLAIGLWTAKTLSAESVIAAIEAAWPGARANVTEARELAASRVGSRRVGGGQARLAAPEWFALGGTDPASGDPLRAVFAALVDGGGGRASFQVLARPAPGRRVARARAAALSLRRGEPTGGNRAGGALSSLTRFVAGRTAPLHSSTSDPLAQSDVRVVTEKVNNPPHFEVAIRYGVEGEPGRIGRRVRRRRLRQLGAALGLFTGRNHLVGRVLLRAAVTLRNRRVHRGFLCSAPELAALAHLPEEPPAYGMRAAPARTVLPPRNVSGGSTGTETWGAGEVDDVA